MRALSTILEDTVDNSDANALAEMHATKDELRRQNQTLMDNVHNIKHRQQEFNPYMRWNCCIPRGDGSYGSPFTLRLNMGSTCP